MTPRFEFFVLGDSRRAATVAPAGATEFFNVRGRSHDATFASPGPSLKFAPSGALEYEVGRARHRVADDWCLILNGGTPYRIRARAATHSFCVFFQPGLLALAQRTAASACTALLDDVDMAAGDEDGFEFLHPVDDTLHALLAFGASHFRADALDDGELESYGYALTWALARTRLAQQVRALELPIKRPQYRAELFRRLARAHDMMLADVAARHSVQSLAGIACLSPFHFDRLFRRAYGAAPLRYLRQARLERARALLVRDPQAPIAAVARRVGFANPEHFATRFKAAWGESPGSFRNRARTERPHGAELT